MDATDRSDLREFGKLLRHHRIAARLSQEQLAERAGLSAHSISNLERGVPHVPRADTMHLLVSALQLSDEDRLRLLHAIPDQSDAVPKGVAASNTPHATACHVPLPPNGLIGRAGEIETLRVWLRSPDVRLVTLTGAPGVGKTHLGLHVAREVASVFADDAWFVALAALRAPSQVLRTIARAVGVAETRGKDLAHEVRAYLHDRHLLLVLDNFEHLVSASSLVAELLAASPGLKVLVTSRAALHLRGEREFAVAPLALPVAGTLPSLDELARIPAVALFVERARAVTPGFALTAQNAPAVVSICRRLDGLPLAIELAATRMRVFSPQALLAHLEPRLPLLTAGAGDLPARQRTLRDTLAWSYDLLPRRTQAVFRWLSVFAGGCTLEAAQAVCTGALEGPSDLLDELSALLDHHLLQRADGVGSESRYTMLETVREYAQERSRANGEASAAARAHAAHYMALAEEMEPQLRGPEAAVWCAMLDGEHDNLQAALSWAVAQCEPEMGLRLAAALWRYWYTRGVLSEGRQWIERLLSLAAAAGDDVSASVRVRALCGAGVLAGRQGDYAQARVLTEDAAALGREHGDSSGVAMAVNQLAQVALEQGDYSRATAAFEESLALKRDLGDHQGMARSLNGLANVANVQGDYERALQLYERALVLFREVGDQHGAAMQLNNLADVAWKQGRLSQARAWGEESLALMRALEYRVGEGYAVTTLGTIIWAQGDHERAVELLERGLNLRREQHDTWGVAESMVLLGKVALSHGERTVAATCFHEALDLFRSIGAHRSLADCLETCAELAQTEGLEGLPELAAWLLAAGARLRAELRTPVPTIERALYDATKARVEQALGKPAFAVAWDKGYAMTLEEALRVAEGVEVAGATAEVAPTAHCVLPRSAAGGDSTNSRRFQARSAPLQERQAEQTPARTLRKEA